jgi:hypothetical protein
MAPQPLHRRAAAAAAFTTTPPPTTPHITRGSTPPLPCTPPRPPPYTPQRPCTLPVLPPVSTPQRRVWRPTPTLRAASTTSPSRTACRTSQQVILPEKSTSDENFLLQCSRSRTFGNGSGSSFMDPDPTLENTAKIY